MKKESWLISGDGVYQNGSRVVSRYGPNINSLLVGHTVGILVDNNHGLHLYVNGVDQGVACQDIPERVWAVFDLYGKCDEIVINTSLPHHIQLHHPHIVCSLEKKVDKYILNC